MRSALAIRVGSAAVLAALVLAAAGAQGRGQPPEHTLEEMAAVVAAGPRIHNPQAVVDALQALEAAGARAVPALIAELEKGQTAEGLEFLIHALRNLRGDAIGAAPMLERYLASGPPEIRLDVASTLARIDPRPDSPAVPVLESCVADASEPSSTRIVCVNGLGAIGNGAGADELIAILRDPAVDVELRRWAAEKLESAALDFSRAPLRAAMTDPDGGVRLIAGARLLGAEPQPASEVIEVVAQDLCAGLDAAPTSWIPHEVLGALEDVSALNDLDRLNDPLHLSSRAVASLAAGLRSSDESCRQWTAVLLARLDPERGVRELDVLGEALRGGVLDLGPGAPAAHALASMGCAARGHLDTLRAELGAVGWDAEAYVRGIEDSPLEHCNHEALELVATVDRDVAVEALLRGPRGVVRAFRAGDRFFDFEIASIEPGAMSIRLRRVTDDLRISVESRRIEMFDRRPPALVEPGAAGDQPRVDIDFEGELDTYLSLMSILGLDVLLEGGTSVNVDVAVRRVLVDHALEEGLRQAGLRAQRVGPLLVLGRSEGKARPAPPLPRDPALVPVSLSLSDIALEDLAAILARLLEVEIELPPGPHPRLTAFVQDVGAETLLAILIWLRGWTYQVDGARILVSAPSG
jgi:HEAT repeat protein